MQSSTYLDIIEEKIAEWRSGVKKFEEQAQKESAETQTVLNIIIKRLNTAIATASFQLHELDRQENINNTMATKDKILEIFESIDKNLVVHDHTTPYML